MPETNQLPFRCAAMAPATSGHQAADAASIGRRVAHAWQILESYLNELPTGTALAGARVLELGPGPTLGAAALLACHGATVTTADPYNATWDDAFHVPFFEALLASLRERRGGAGLDDRPLRELLRARAFVPAVVRRFDVDAESLDVCAPRAFDLVVSCAVLEHVRDVPAALRQLARVTRAGGLGVHVVDFRDHRDFEKPLEYLRLPASFFWRMFDLRWGECGNRWRYGSMAKAFASAGFDIAAMVPHLGTDEQYLQGLRPHLDADFAGLSDEDLRMLCATITCVRTTRPALTVAADNSGFTAPPRDQVLPVAQQPYRRIAVYGAGAGALAALDLLDRLGWTAHVTAVFDSDPAKAGTRVAGHAVTRFEAWPPDAFDLIVVASEPGRAAISAMLTAAGLYEAPAFRELGFVTAFTPVPAAEAAA